MSLNSEIQAELLFILAPLMSNEKERSSLLHQAFGINAPVLQQIDCSGSTVTFIPQMLQKLVSHNEVAPGKQALWALLEVVREYVGHNIKERIDKLEPLINSLAKLEVNVVSISQKHTEHLVEVEKLKSSVLNTEFVNLVNLALQTASETYKSGQLPEKQQEEFNYLKEKVNLIKTIEQQLAEVEIKAQNLIQGMMRYLESELAETRLLATNSEKKLIQLSASEKIESQTKIQYYEDLIKTAKKFTSMLEVGKEAANWLNQNLSQLAIAVGKVALNRRPEIKQQATQKQVDDFYLTIELYLECISQCCSWGRYNCLDFPEIPLVLDISIYEIAFKLVKEQIPTYLSNAAIQQIKDYTDYLINRLPYY